MAIVGPSGSGKSTLCSLLVRFYDPLRGQILIDGTDIRTLNATWLRSNLIGMINQVMSLTKHIDDDRKKETEKI